MKEEIIECLNRCFASETESEKKQIATVIDNNEICHIAIYHSDDCDTLGYTFNNKDKDILSRDEFSIIFDKGYHGAFNIKNSDEKIEQDIFIKIKTSELEKPEFKTFSYKDLLSLPKVDKSHDISSHIEGLTGLDEMDIEYDHKNHDERFSIYTVLSYSQGYSGKHGKELKVIEYKDKPVCFVEAFGKWTDSHTYTFIKGSGYKEFVAVLIDLYKNKDCNDDEVDLESELQISSTLYDQIASGEYFVHED